MTSRLFSQALSLAMAGMVTLAILGGIDQRAAQPQHEALLARAAPATTVGVAPTPEPLSGASRS